MHHRPLCIKVFTTPSVKVYGILGGFRLNEVHVSLWNTHCLTCSQVLYQPRKGKVSTDNHRSCCGRSQKDRQCDRQASYLVWRAARKQGCPHWRSAQSRSHLSEWSRIFEPALEEGREQELKWAMKGAMKLILLDCQCLYYSIHQERPFKADYGNNNSNSWSNWQRK